MAMGLNNWNDTARRYPRDVAVHELFREVANRSPQRPAVVLPAEDGQVRMSLSYGALKERASQVAALLRAEGVRPGDRVGLLTERSPLMVAAMLGVLEAGAAFVPLDPAYPRARILTMLHTCAARLVITVPSQADLVCETGVGGCVLDESGTCTRRFGRPAAVEPEATVSAPALATAYIMFTSGSTGTPKGVCVPHRGIVRLVRGTTFTPLDERCVFLQLAPVSFDASTLELWGPLLNGGKCVLYPGPSLPDPMILQRIVERQGVTSVWLTASLFNTLVTDAPHCLEGIPEFSPAVKHFRCPTFN